jgi:hypothetical protein
VEENSKLDVLFRAAETLDENDRMRLIARLWASLPDEYWASPDWRQRASISRMATGKSPQPLTSVLHWISAKVLSAPPGQPAEKIYSAPRRFDLATIFVVTFAYSLLFGVMNYAEFWPSVSLVVGAFITIVGVGQALLYGGKNARVASVITGAVLGGLLSIAGAIAPPRGFSGIVLLFLSPVNLILGACFGYMAGALVGGVFLVADKVRRYFEGRRRDVEQIELAEVEADEESHVSI